MFSYVYCTPDACKTNCKNCHIVRYASFLGERLALAFTPTMPIYIYLCVSYRCIGLAQEATVKRWYVYFNTYVNYIIGSPILAALGMRPTF